MTTQFPPTQVDLSEDRKQATITIGGETIVTDAAGLQSFIGHLGVARSGMFPEVEHHSPNDRAFLQIGGPVLEIVDSDDGRVVRIAMRTPHYGWIGFQFTPTQAVEIGRHLVATFAPKIAPNG